MTLNSDSHINHRKVCIFNVISGYCYHESYLFYFYFTFYLFYFFTLLYLFFFSLSEIQFRGWKGIPLQDSHKTCLTVNAIFSLSCYYRYHWGFLLLVISQNLKPFAFTDLCCVLGEQLHPPDVASGKSLATAWAECRWSPWLWDAAKSCICFY